MPSEMLAPSELHCRVAFVAAAALLIGFINSDPVSAAGQDHLTGCFVPGQTINKTAFGDRPTKPCSINQKMVTLDTSS